MRYTLYLILAFTITFAACSTQKANIPYVRTGMVTCLDHDRQTITLNSEGQAEAIGKAAAYAEMNAFENLLFKGVPNSNQEKAMVPDEYNSVRQNEAFYNDFLDNGGYMKYVMSSTISNEYKSNGVYLVNQRIQIDIHGLRKYLKENNITRSFGL